MLVTKDNEPRYVFDRHYSLTCPHCGVYSNISAVSIPRFEYLARFQPKYAGISYRCDSCNFPIFLRFKVISYDLGNNRIALGKDFQEVERPSETFEYAYLPEPVKSDFQEALSCYSNSCFNAFAAMCRRTVQSTCSDLGARGADRVLHQLKDLQEMAEIDEETFIILKQIIIDGHDGAHPHLPPLNAERAAVLLELMKDVLYQLYVRKGKLQDAMRLRREAI